MNMRVPSSSYVSWILVALAVALWAGVGYFLWTISDGFSARTERIVELDQASRRYETTLRLHTLARETKAERERLEAIAGKSAIDILDAIEAAAEDAGIPITIGQVLGASASGSAVRTASLVVEAEGTFGEVVRAAALLEALPLSSFVEEVHIDRVPEGASERHSEDAWFLVARMQFLTTADLPS